MSENILIDFLKTISEDIHWMRKDIARLARKSYLDDLEKVASTSARQEIWRQCNGTLSSEEIASKIGITLRSVQYFVQDAERKGLITVHKRGYPRVAIIENFASHATVQEFVDVTPDWARPEVF